MKLYHGGISGLRTGDMLRPAPPHVVDGCPVCVARAEGRVCTVGEFRAWLRCFDDPHAETALRQLGDAEDWEPVDPPRQRQAVYITADLGYARWYAGRSQGDLYLVEPVGEVQPTAEDHFKSWTCREARVLAVVERRVRLSRRDRREMIRRWKRADQAALAAGLDAAAAMTPFLRPVAETERRDG